MVTIDRSGGRAQLILIGAIALAVVIIGLTVVVNSVYVTQVDSISEASPQIDEAREFEYESNKGTRSLVMRLNHRNRTLTADELAAVVSDNVTAYSHLMAESYASSRGSYASLTYNNGGSAFGSRVVQAEDNIFTSKTANQSKWYVGQSGVYRKMGWFSLNVDVQNSSEAPTYLNVSSRSEWVNYSINRTTDSGTKLRIHSNVSNAGNTTALCDPSRDRVLLDVVQGDAFTDDCTFNGTAEIDPPYTVRYVHGDNLVGKYELVYNESVSSTSRYPVCNSGPGDSIEPADEPCSAPAVWIANVSTRFAGSELDYANSFNVSVYAEAP